jgi:long-chain fatty acid transport protein
MMNPGGALAPIGGGINGTGTVESKNNDFFIPNIGYTHPIDEVSSVGIAIFGNGGMNSDYRAIDTLNDQFFGPLGTYGGNNACFNPPSQLTPQGCFALPGTQTLGGGNAGVNLEQLGISLGYAREMSENFTLGASFLIGYQTVEVRGLGAFQSFTQTFTQSALSGAPTSPVNLTDNGDDSSWGYGFQLGMLWDINPQMTLGASIRSKMYMDEFDKYKDLFAEQGDFDMPAVATIGLAYRPDDRWAVALDVQQIWYGDVKSIANDNKLATNCDLMGMFGGQYESSYCLGGDNGAGFGWRDMTVIKLGVQYAATDALTLRGGYSHGNQPIRGSQVAFNALAPAVIEDHWTLGATYKLASNYELTFWGMYAPEETVKGPGAFTGTQAPEIKMHQYELGVNFGWLFN